MPTLSVSRSQIYVGPCQLSTFICALKMYFYSRVCVCVYRVCVQLLQLRADDFQMSIRLKVAHVDR